MKTTFLFSLLLASASLGHANPEIAAIIAQEYGVATSVGIVLLQSPPSAVDPVQWAVYARDPFRPGELVRAALSAGPAGWAPKAVDGGSTLIARVPPQVIDFNRVKFRSADALKVAQQNAMLAKVNFVTASYQLAANVTTGAPEWGLALNGSEGNEIGFIVVSAETGAVIHQQWGNGLAGNDDAPSPPNSKGEKAADDVRRAARNAWEWTGDTGLEVGHFFKRLFKSRD